MDLHSNLSHVKKCSAVKCITLLHKFNIFRYSTSTSKLNFGTVFKLVSKLVPFCHCSRVHSVIVNIRGSRFPGRVMESVSHLLYRLSLEGRGGCQLSLGERQGTPWTGRQSIAGQTYRDRQPLTLTFTPTGNLESPVTVPN